VNALRALTVRARLPDGDDQTDDRERAVQQIAKATLALALDDDDRRDAADVAREARRLATSAARADRFATDVLDRWLRSSHVTPSATGWAPSSGPIVLRVGGLSGALAVAMLAERSATLRTAICGRCRTTWAVWREWTPDLALAAGLCATCQSKDRGVQWRARPKASPQGQEDHDDA
jgi:hypothetical protein